MSTLKIVHLITFKNGGAGTAVMRLHAGLINNGVASSVLFLQKGKEEPNVFLYQRKSLIEKLIFKVFKKIGLPLTSDDKNDNKLGSYKRKIELFSFAETSFSKLGNHKLLHECDIIHLHWVSGFVDYTTFFTDINKPVIWTLHDMNPIQGGFHYKNDENKFKDYFRYLNEEQINLKISGLSVVPNDRLTVVSPSNWLRNLSCSSEILGRFRNINIPNPINTDVFKRLSDAHAGRTESSKRFTVLFIAESLSNHRKGFDLVIEMIKISDFGNKFRFIAVGEHKNMNRVDGLEYVGRITSESELAILYNKVDAFMLPSREDNLPNTMVESLCCGTPVISFKVGGIEESITNEENGVLASEISARGLHDALLACVSMYAKFDREKISRDAHARYGAGTNTEKYISLYRNCLKNNMAV